MSRDIIQYALIAGEVSPKLFGRPDLEKYDFGVAIAENFFVDYRGGASTRPGTCFVDFLENPESNTRYFKFQYSPDTANTYVVVFGDGYIRFIQSGAYVVEDDVTVSGASQANPCVITATAHGYSNGDMVRISGVAGMTELNGRTFIIANVTTNTFSLKSPLNGGDVDSSAYTAYTSGGTVNRVYTLANPYDEADLPALKAYQIRDLLRLTHPDYPVKNLTRTDATDWSLDDETTGATNSGPTGLVGTASGAGTAGVGFVVTYVDANGIESLPSEMEILDNIVNYASTAGSATLRWDGVAGALYYNVYRTIILTDGQYVHGGMQVGWVGRSDGTVFTDPNITPDFTIAPPEGYDPFNNGGVAYIEITNQGAGYSSVPVVSVSGGSGSGFEGYALLDKNAGQVVGVVVRKPGSGYASPTVSFTGGGGSGAAATATLNPASGNNPSVSALFSQRQIYANTTNNPLAIFGSRVGQFSNFDTSVVINDGDSFEYELDTPTVAGIRHLVTVRGGLLAMSASGVWLFSGTGGVLTPLNAGADPQTFFGASNVSPLTIDTDVMYCTEKESTARLLGYNDFAKIYGGEDLTLLSSHLFSSDNPIQYWTYQETPNRLVWAVRADGTMLCLTLVKDQKLFGWTRIETRGYFRDAVTVEEDGKDVTYLAVERIVNGNTVKFIEKFAPRNFTHIENAVAVDSSLTLSPSTVNATLVVTGLTGTVTLTAGSSVFTADNVGDIVRVGGAKIEITAYTSGTVVEGFVLRDFTQFIPQTTTLPTFAANSWTMATPTSTVSGLWHLEGETVTILGDGNVLTEAVVTAGAVTLSETSTVAQIGLGYTCKIQTLPPTAPDAIIEGHRKDIVGVALRMHETRGLRIGATLDSLYDMRDRTTETYGEPIVPRTAVAYQMVDSDWDENGQTWLVQEFPLPASILSFVKDLEVGDDND